MERKLAAILAADVVGYSRLMGEDETGTLNRLKSLRRKLVQPKLGEFKGRVVKLMGDGLLAEFPSVVEAAALLNPESRSGCTPHGHADFLGAQSKLWLSEVAGVCLWNCCHERDCDARGGYNRGIPGTCLRLRADVKA